MFLWVEMFSTLLTKPAMFPSCLKIQLLVLLLNLSCCSLSICFIAYPSANFSDSSSWLNHPTAPNISYWRFVDGTHVRTILTTAKNGSTDFCFGFYNNGTVNTFYLAILKLPFVNASDITTVGDYYEFQFPPVIVWSVGQDVEENSTLQLRSKSLVLKHANGSSVWSTKEMMAGQTPIARMELISGGNFRLVSTEDTVLWESFSHPTNTWLPGQSLPVQGGLNSSIFGNDLGGVSFSVRVSDGSIQAFAYGVALQQYRSIFEFGKDKNYSDFGIMALLFSGGTITYKAYSEDFQYLRLEPNGHLNLFRYDGYNGSLYSDLLEDKTYGGCDYPMVCGRASVCNRGKCSCAGAVSGRSEFFTPANATEPSLGCVRVYPYSCKDAKLHTFLALENTTFFTFNTSHSHVSAETCMSACLKNCNCKVVLFRYVDDITRGNCSFLLDAFTLIDRASLTEELNYNSISYIKVQKKKKEPVSVPPGILITSIVGFCLLLIICLGSFYYFRVWKNRHSSKDENDDSFVQVSTLVKEFTFQDLSTATSNFGIKIGEGGFGSVYAGTLRNGTKIAVKRLNHLGKKEFLTEVKTIGSIHHFNLVKLIGYCAGKSTRFLVYEYVCNGSLDKWIFKSNASQCLSWERRKAIITGIANGLEYLHVGCNPNIIHFDIKPQNILLDQEFNVKIADFGLAKWINRGQSDISAVPKGTPGYIAPELFAGRKASVKVDVFSFGIVILEIVCGRKCWSMHHESAYLIDEVWRKAEEGRLLDLVDIYANGDLQNHREEAVKFLEIAIRCLQASDRRPSMPSVLKLLEGSLALEPMSDYSSLAVVHNAGFSRVVGSRDSTLPVNSLLSGPR